MIRVSKEQFESYLKLNAMILTGEETGGDLLSVIQFKNEEGVVMAQSIKWRGREPIRHIRVIKKLNEG